MEELKRDAAGSLCLLSRIREGHVEPESVVSKGGNGVLTRSPEHVVPRTCICQPAVRKNRRRTLLYTLQCRDVAAKFPT